MRIVALDDYGGVFANSSARKRLEEAGHTVEAIAEAPRGAALVKALAGAEVAFLTQQRTPIGAEEMKALRSSGLKVILNSGRNGGHLDLKAAEEQGLRVMLEGQGDPTPTAELTWALLLASARNVVENAQSLRAGAWQASGGIGLNGKTLGVLGLGRIGSIVARVGAAFGMKVLASGRAGGTTEKEAADAGYAFTAVQRELFEQADFLSIHVRASKDTEGLVIAADLAAMKPTATIINTSRSSLIAPGALEAALKAGRPGFAAIDVYDEEPVLDTSAMPLLQLPNVLATPHLGYCSSDNMEKIYIELVAAFLKEFPPSGE